MRYSGRRYGPRPGASRGSREQGSRRGICGWITSYRPGLGFAPAHPSRRRSVARGRPSTFGLSGLTGRAHSSAVECLLCKEDALGSNPSGSISRVRLEPCSLSGNRGSIRVRRTDAPLRASASGKGGRTSAVDGRAYETVCTCDPDAHWTRFIGSQSDHTVATVPSGE